MEFRRQRHGKDTQDTCDLLGTVNVASRFKHNVQQEDQDYQHTTDKQWEPFLYQYCCSVIKCYCHVGKGMVNCEFNLEKEKKKKKKKKTLHTQPAKWRNKMQRSIQQNWL